MKTRNYKTFTITTFETTDGEKVFVKDGKGKQVYATRTTKGQGYNFATFVIDNNLF